MLNTNEIKGSGNSKQELIPVGAYPARVVQVIDLGVQKRQAYEGVVKAPCNQVWLTLELPTEFMKDDKGVEDKEKPRWLSRRVNMFSLSQENAMSTKYSNAIDPTGELKGDWGSYLGMPVQVTVVHSKDGKWDNVGALSPIMKGMEVGELANDPKLFDVDNPDMDVYNSLPDFLHTIMKEGVKYKGSKLESQVDGMPAEVITEDEAPY